MAGATKATKAAAGLKKGSGRKATRVHTGTHFFKPNTLKLARNPVVLKKSVPKSQTAKLKAYDVIKYPLATDSALHQIDADNTIVFIVDVKANKSEIKAAVKNLYEIQAVKINTLITPAGAKKAYVKLSADQAATDVANAIGLI
jgi:large subunit ribosomal protein L23Ae